MLAPPRWRSPIGRHLSYPLGYKEIEALLAPACERIDLEMDFYSYKAARPNEARVVHAVLDVQYGRSYLAAHRGEYHYRLWVCPVPRPLRAAVHAVLATTGLPQVRDWLLAPRVPHWFATTHSLRLSFDTAEQRLVRSEHDAA